MYRSLTDKRHKDNRKRSTVQLGTIAVPGLWSCVTGTSRSSLQWGGCVCVCVYLRTGLMLNSGLELVLRALSENSCPERGGDVAYLFIDFTRISATALHAIYIFLCNHFPCSNSWIMYLHGTGGNIFQLYLFTGLNFILTHPAHNIFSALERTAQVTFNENAMHNENLQLIFLCVSYYHPQYNYFLHR